MSSSLENTNNICSRCIMDTTVPCITFDESGVCNYCKMQDKLVKKYPSGEEGTKKLSNIIQKIKYEGRNNPYDCIVGVSGGTDSTYTLYLAKKYGLRPLAVHFDNGWNSEIAVSNIKNAVSKLDVDLYTHVADWEEFKDLQISFLKAAVPDAEIPTDYIIISVLHEVAKKEGIKYIVDGHSFRAEGTTPIGWSYQDGRYIQSVHKIFGKQKITSFPILSLSKLMYYSFVKGIRHVRPLEYMHYSKREAKEILKKELSWKDYGGHHHDSIYTQFFQSYYLINKFNIDKRKREYSARIRSNVMTRQEALKKITSNPYPVDYEIVNYTISKLGFTKNEFDTIMRAPIKTFLDYPTYFQIIQRFRFPIKVACHLNLVPAILYEKYGKALASNIQRYWKEFENKKNVVK